MSSKQGMTREQAHELYDSMKKAMEAKYGKKGLAALIADDKRSKSKPTKAAATKQAGPAAGASLKADRPAADIAQKMAVAASRISGISHRRANGQRAALTLIVIFGLAKLTVSALEASGFMSAQAADAAMVAATHRSAQQGPRFSSEEVNILKSLDERRTALEERAKKVEDREEEIERRDREFAARLTQLREISDKLKVDREKNEKKRSGQLDQLAAVYGSMNPQEAAELLEQLDVTISLSLVERMPEKRIGQILALMSPERALTLTQMLSKK